MASYGFSGGDKFKAKLAEIIKNIDKAKEVNVGFMSEAEYPDGTKVAMVAAIQNFGAPAANIPPRPFFNQMVEKKSPNWSESLGNILAIENYNSKKALELMGEGISSQLQDSILQADFAPLAASTIKKKGFAKQLIDTAHMINSVQYEVDGEFHDSKKGLGK